MMLVQATDANGDCATAFSATAEESSSKNATCADEIRVEQHEISADIKALVKEFASVFAEPPDKLPPQRHIAHTIPLEPGSKPVAQRNRRLSYAQEQEMVAQIQTLMNKGWIDPSSSP